MALIEKVAALREQIGVPAGGGSIPDDVQAIAKQLGVWEKVQGKPLLEQVDDCYHVVFADAKPVATADVTPQVVVVTGQPVASAGTVVPLLVGSLAKVAVEPTPTPKPKPKADLKLGSTPSHGSPPSNGALNTELNNVARNTNDTARARARRGGRRPVVDQRAALAAHAAAPGVLPRPVRDGEGAARARRRHAPALQPVRPRQARHSARARARRQPRARRCAAAQSAVDERCHRRRRRRLLGVVFCYGGDDCDDRQ